MQWREGTGPRWILTVGRMLLVPILLVAGLLTCARSGRTPAVVSPIDTAAYSRPARATAPRPPAPRLVPGTPCTVAAAACVDLTTQRAWLIDHGKVVRGPVPVHSGGPDRATPQGTFTVSWKDRNHVSHEQPGTPMPDAVFFAAGGIAFHVGPLTRSSAGCVHLRPVDAVAFYAALKRGAQVQVRAPGGDTASKAPAAARPGASHPSPAPATGARGNAGSKRREHVQPGIPGVPTIGPAPRSDYLSR